MLGRILMLACVAAGSVFATTSYSFRTDVQGTPSLEGSNPDLTWTLVDFGTAAVGTYGPGFSQEFLTLSGVTFSTTSSFSIEMDGTLRMPTGSNLTITLPGGALAFGFDMLVNPFAAVTLSFTGDGTLATPFSGAAVTETTFYGARVTTSISPITLSNTLGPLRLANFEFGTGNISTETPEPSTFAMLGTALLVLPLLRRYRRRPC